MAPGSHDSGVFFTDFGKVGISYSKAYKTAVFAAFTHLQPNPSIFSG
jgi:hypothetical protein